MKEMLFPFSVAKPLKYQWSNFLYILCYQTISLYVSNHDLFFGIRNNKIISNLKFMD
jgi:hypothetical protein